MAEPLGDFFINLYIEKNRIIIPERITVQKNVNIYWRILNPNRIIYFTEIPIEAINFSIYFDMNSPFSWKRSDSNGRTGNSLFPLIGGGLAEEDGEYKYGVQAQLNRSNQVLFDEDPWLIITR